MISKICINPAATLKTKPRTHNNIITPIIVQIMIIPFFPSLNDFLLIRSYNEIFCLHLNYPYLFVTNPYPVFLHKTVNSVNDNKEIRNLPY
jgi:hypothetical protein